MKFPIPPSLLLRQIRTFASSFPQRAKNRIYPTPIRNEEEFSSLLLISASTRIPLLSLWTASWCPSCKIVAPIIRQLIQDGVGEEQGSVSFAEVEMDSPLLTGYGLRYGINSMPTLLAFDRQEAQLTTKVGRLEELKSRAFLTGWIEREAKRHGEGGGGGSFGGLFGR